MRMYAIHVVEDDIDIRKALTRGLEHEGFAVTANANGSEVLDTIRNTRVDLMLLDIRLPGMDGLSVCRQLRSHRFTFPIIMLTARDEEIDRITGLETGADDYVVKPFSFRELVSRIRAHLRRAYGDYSPDSPRSPDGRNEYSFGAFHFDENGFRLYRLSGDTREEIYLTPTEARILVHFLQNEGTTLRRDHIIRAVWGESVYLEGDRTVDVHIRHLREKIEDDPAQPRIITTVRGYGYRLDAPVKKP